MTPPAHFDIVAIVLHWLLAGLIAVAFGLGLTIDLFPKEWEHAIVNVHALIGLTILLLTAVRMWWRLGHKPPPMSQQISPAVRRAAAIVHFLLYVLVVVVTLIGIPTLLYRGRGLDFGLFQIASPFARTREIFGPLTEAHELAAYALVGLAIGHVLAALYHHFIRRDEVLLQMIRAN
ncbi:MAG TPA: cytochrome b/b6 domain-containing protein [Rhizomicrobium sp.]|nr:cytochrome b/b6 domain-containing protein [Rhizomicrobium sp.]